MCYEQGAQAAEMLMNVETNDTMIYRLTDTMGESIIPEGEQEEIIPVQRDLALDDKVYCQVDGSMLLTREEGWKETKLGRIFTHKSILPETKSRNWIVKSDYVAHLGGHQEFENKMSHYLDNYEHLSDQLVFINDGAKWIQNWISSEYPRATQILDFYHAMSHIAELVKTCIKSKDECSVTNEKIGKVLKEQGYDAMMEIIEELKIETKKQKKQKQKLINYLENNRQRMDYPIYKQRGLLIGSGAIESAHRTVLQERLKKAGQRWSSLKKLIGIRVLNKSDKWNIIRNKLKKVA